MSMKKNNYLILSAFFATCLGSNAFSQAEPAYEQYQFNQLVLNPAYAGSKNSFETNFFLHRQDIKMPGAPSTESVTFHAPVASQKLGLGLKFYHDHIGVTDKYLFGFDFAYQMYLGEGVLSAGLELSLSNYSVNFSKLDAFQNGDPTFTNEPVNILTPNAGLGVYYRNDKFYMGFASLNIVEDQNDTTQELTSLQSYEQSRHYNFHVGGLIDAGDHLTLKPGALLKYTYGGPAQIDLNLHFIIEESFWVGLGYKTNNSMSVMAEYVLNYDKTLSGNEFSFGYAYNFLLDDLAPYLGPTHEIFLGYRFNKHNTRVRSPRFF